MPQVTKKKQNINQGKTCHEELSLPPCLRADKLQFCLQHLRL